MTPDPVESSTIMRTVATALFETSDAGFRPTPYSRGPWDPGLAHGGAVGALLAEVLESRLSDYQPVRLVVDLLRPVPMQELTLDAHVVRTGARLGLAQAELSAGGKHVASASLLALAPTELEATQVSEPPPDAPDQGVNSWGHSGEEEAFLGGALSFRFVGEPAQAMWVSLTRPVLPERPPSALARVAAAADVPSAIASYDGRRLDGVGFINADVTFHLSRLPVDEWVRVSATSRWEPNGIGVVSADVWDRTGRVGQVGQALVLAVGLTPS